MTDSEKLDLILQKVNDLDNKFNRLDDKVTGIELHLENVTDRGIKIIGEGHADLSRKLDDALKVENEKELLLIRMNYLEGELERIKKRLSELEKTA